MVEYGVCMRAKDLGFCQHKVSQVEGDVKDPSRPSWDRWASGLIGSRSAPYA